MTIRKHSNDKRGGVRFQRVKSQRMVRAESLSDRGESMEGGGVGGRR